MKDHFKLMLLKDMSKTNIFYEIVLYSPKSEIMICCDLDFQYYLREPTVCKTEYKTYDIKDNKITELCHGICNDFEDERYRALTENLKKYLFNLIPEHMI